MATDTTQLLTLLEAYQRSLNEHLALVRAEFEQVEQRWGAFNDVYRGDAADQFRSHWLRTVRQFHEYVTHSVMIERFLQERIEALRNVDRPDAL